MRARSQLLFNPEDAGHVRMKRLFLSLAILIAHLLVSCGNGTEDDPETSTCKEMVPCPYGLWSEFLEPEEILEQIPSLKEHGIGLYQNIRSEDIGDPGFADLFEEAACMGLEVRAWLTLPEEEGYWPNEKNVDLFYEEALRLADWIRSSGWGIDWIVVDMEPALQMFTALIDLIEQGDIEGAFDLLFDNRDSAAYFEALGKYEDMVETLHTRGFKVMVVTIPIVLDDIWDRDALIQDVMNIPVHGIPWDEFSFMVYTTTFSRLLQSELSSDLVYSYGLDAKRAYQDKAAIDLGVIAHGGMVEGEGISDVDEVRAQVGAAKEAGITRIHAYSLDGIVHLDEQDPWYEAFQAPQTAADKEPIVRLFRFGLKTLDFLF
jgi:hypothetical protein